MTLLDYRKANGLTLAALAKKLGSPVSTVHSWECLRRRPDWKAVARIEAATSGQVTASDFVPRHEVAA
ncbi:helix-turn-helix domain-containing protein [Pseudoroseomonas ludipueritiae]|uniref:Helix-turn-helix transcriptional regulator n=1 Tax=Pseudoroseomonas ludipueritiae TaxID=198093 RepID=A0ABR7R5E0_9PROT|nr:helix-turn-helix transcriptional regulator [Pseudoroseomonas ludipueritiae]MBC9176792.1 helix-turn-helix transcriptional regulator [Pseudoroseomonas ludipueritiae]